MVRLTDIIQNRNTDPEDEKRKKSKPKEETPYPVEEQADEEEPLHFLPEGAMRSAPPDAHHREEKTDDEEAEVSFSDFTPLPVPHPGGRKKGPGSDKPARETGSLRSPTKLDVKQRYCPYLGGKSNQEDVTEHPMPQNVCYAKETVEKKLLRTVTLPFTAIPAQRQREFCLGTFSRCHLFKEKEGEK
jgi:hypothetical protein